MQDISAGSKSPGNNEKSGVGQKPSSASHEKSLLQYDDIKSIQNLSENNCTSQVNESAELLEDVFSGTSLELKLNSHSPVSCMEKSPIVSNEPTYGAKRPQVWGRTAARKNLSMESIDVTIDDEVEIQRLEDTKSDLQNKIADEVKGNEILEVSLESRKRALHQRRQALENEVARLQDELQKERDKRTAMEAGLFQGSFSIPPTIDEKTKVELEEIAQAEIDIITLKQKAKDLGVQLSEQLEKNIGSAGELSNQLHHHQTSAKLKDEQRDNEAAIDRSTSMDVYQDGAAESENDKKRESSSFPNKHPPQNQQAHSVRTVTSRSTAPIHSKKSGTRGEGSNPFALTKLTARLNFLKEKRCQIANELQNIDKSRSPGQAVRSQDKDRGSEPQQSIQNQNKSQASAVQSVLQSEKGREGESSQSLQDSEKFRKSSIFSLHTVDRGNRPETCLDRGKSEGNVAYESDESRGYEGQSHGTPTRTFSR